MDIQGERHMMWLRGSTTLRDIYSKEFDIVSMVPLLTLTPPYQSGYSPPAWLTRVHRIVESTLMRWRIGVKISDQIITIARR